jgi:hypothetical protein
VWLEETAKGELDATGRLSCIDAPHSRHWAELALAERAMQLAGWCAERVVGVNVDVAERKRKNISANCMQSSTIASRMYARPSPLLLPTPMEASSSMDHFVASLDGRIHSMPTTHELLSATR